MLAKAIGERGLQDLVVHFSENEQWLKSAMAQWVLASHHTATDTVELDIQSAGGELSFVALARSAWELIQKSGEATDQARQVCRISMY